MFKELIPVHVQELTASTKQAQLHEGGAEGECRFCQNTGIGITITQESWRPPGPFSLLLLRLYTRCKGQSYITPQKLD